jgi:hypothetical protein
MSRFWEKSFYRTSQGYSIESDTPSLFLHAVDHLSVITAVYTAVLNLEYYPRGLLTRPSDKLLAPEFVFKDGVYLR